MNKPRTPGVNPSFQVITFCPVASLDQVELDLLGKSVFGTIEYGSTLTF
jgi:hypothetical protein